jgi:hypothetical protein
MQSKKNEKFYEFYQTKQLTNITSLKGFGYISH